MTNPLTKEQLQAIIDDADAPNALNGGKRVAIVLDPTTVKAMATLAQQSLDREGVKPDRDSIRFARQFADAYRSGEQGAAIDCDAAQALALSIDDILSALSPQPETAEEVGETEAVAWRWKWGAEGEWFYGPERPDTEHPRSPYRGKLSAVEPLYAHPAPQSPPAPVVDEGMWEIEAYDADDNFAFGASGSLEDVRREIAHYAAVYAEPLRYERVQRSTVTLAALEGRS